MKITLYGASGMIGSRILNELLRRGHTVTAVVRDPSKIAQAGVTARVGDVLDAHSVAETARGADVVISAYAPPADATERLSAATRSLIAGLQEAGVRRFLMVGGAGSLEAAPGLPLMNTPNFPAIYKPYAIAHRDALAVLRQADLDWTNISPAAVIEPGERKVDLRASRQSVRWWSGIGRTAAGRVGRLLGLRLPTRHSWRQILPRPCSSARERSSATDECAESIHPNCGERAGAPRSCAVERHRLSEVLPRCRCLGIRARNVIFPMMGVCDIEVEFKRLSGGLPSNPRTGH